MAALHKWAQQHIHHTIKRWGSPKRGLPVGAAPSPSGNELAHLADQYAVLMGAIIQGIMWRKQSPYGRFSPPNQSSISTPWWNSQCSNALKHIRSERGTADQKQASLHLRRTIIKAKRDYWKSQVTTIEKKVKWSMILSPQLHKRIQMSIKPQLKASQIIKVKGETLSKQEP